MVGHQLAMLEAKAAAGSIPVTRSALTLIGQCVFVRMQANARHGELAGRVGAANAGAASR